MNNNMNVVTEMIFALEESKEWADMLSRNPMYDFANQHLKEVIREAPEGLRDRLETAYNILEDATTELAMLFGMQIARDLFATMENPTLFGYFILNKMKK